MRNVYLDHAAATPLDPRVRDAMEPFLSSAYGNPSSFHAPGKAAKDAVEAARTRVAALIGARPDEILFTSGGTEADNLAVLGVARASASHGKHLVTSKAEHQAVLEAMHHLEKKEGFDVTYLDPDRYGMVSAASVRDVLRPDTTFVSIMYGNNEIGTISPVAEIGKAVAAFRSASRTAFPLLHTDACQAAGYLPLDVTKLHVDLMTVNGGKIHGPKGSGALFVRRGIKLQPIQFGGAQERGLRPGTENVAAIVGFAAAVELAQAQREAESARLVPLRDMLIAGIRARVPKVRLNGHPEARLPNNVNVSFMDLEGEALLLYLDAKGVYASTGSACTSASLDPSHVILAIGMPYEVAHGSIRFSLGRATTQADIDYVLEVLPPLVQKLRAFSPVSVDEKYFQE